MYTYLIKWEYWHWYMFPRVHYTLVRTEGADDAIKSVTLAYQHLTWFLIRNWNVLPESGILLTYTK